MSRADRFDRADFEPRYGRVDPPRSGSTPLPEPPRSAATPRRADTERPRLLLWPIAPSQIQRVGDTVMADRNGSGQPHKGIDIIAKPGTEVVAALDGTVLRVIDGRQGKTRKSRRAGLFVDVRGSDGWIYRYLHLGEAKVRKGEAVKQGTLIGVVAAPFTSGLKELPHLHFEIRQEDYQRSREDYGTPVDPLHVLPALRS